MGIIFSEGSGVADSLIFKNQQAPMRMFLEKKAEAYETMSALPHIFNVMNTKHYAEKFAGMTSQNGFEPVGENGDYPKDDQRESYDKVLEVETWKDSFAISREMVDDARYIDMKKKPSAFIAAYYRTRELFGASLLGGAIAGKTSVKFRNKVFDTACADKHALFATDHPSILRKPAQSNLFKDAFSVDALFAMETAMQNFKGDNGEILNVAPTTIVIPNDYGLKKDVFAAIGADKDPESANNGFNGEFGRWNVLVWPYLNQFLAAGAKPWMLLDENWNKENGGNIWLDRVPLEVRSEVQGNDANVWKGYSRFTAGFNDWRHMACGGMTGGTELISKT